jgi:hypothetical protein
MAGFFAQGELGPVGGQNFLHGFTASMALFRGRTEPVDAEPAAEEAEEPQPEGAPARTSSSLGSGSSTE